MDIVLFAVKLWDTEKAARDMKPIVGANTRIISLQNGVDSVDILRSVLGSRRTSSAAAPIWAAWSPRPA